MDVKWSILLFYSGYCELVAIGNIFTFLFEIYYNNNLYAKFGVPTYIPSNWKY